MTVFKDVKREEILKLLKKGFQEEKIKSVYENLRLKKEGVNLILYNSGKLLLQGKVEEVEKCSQLLGKKKLEEVENKPFRKETGVIIGSDESLKGDTFGGIVVAAVKADKQDREKLRELGVQDSKNLSDQEILGMARKIREIVSCEVKSLLPEEYNKFDGNITEMLNRMHLESARYLFPGKHVVDKYPGCGVGDLALEKAESKYIEVAAASVLAREAALKQLSNLSILAGFRLPKGSTHVKLALHELQERNLDFSKFVKVNFKNVEEFLNS